MSYLPIDDDTPACDYDCWPDHHTDVYTFVASTAAESPNFPAAVSKQEQADHAAALAAMFAGQAVDRETIYRQFGREVTHQALFAAWSAGKALYDGKTFRFMGPVQPGLPSALN